MGRDFENRKHAIMKTAAVKSKVYSKYGRQVYVAAKNGVPDPDANPALRNMIERAKRDQVPSHVIEKAIEKAKGIGGADYSTVRYEGFGPGGCLVIIDCLTDNNMRTITDVRNCFTKTGAKLSPPGSVARLFDHVAVLEFDGSDADAVLEALLAADVAVEDVKCDEGVVTVYAPATEFYKAKTAITQAFPQVEFKTQEITFLPQTTKDISADDLPMLEKFIEMLNECEDVQEIYHNAVMPE